jgi:hypothetical protein
MNFFRGLLSSVFTVGLFLTVNLGLLLLSAREATIAPKERAASTCEAPQGWSAHAVQVGENLTTIAEIVGVEPAELVIANCLQGDLHPGDTIYLPPPSSSERTCGPPEDWVLYSIQPGDSLPLLAERYNVSEAALWHANCISEDMTFPSGFRIYVPPVAETP